MPDLRRSTLVSAERFSSGETRVIQCHSVSTGCLCPQQPTRFVSRLRPAILRARAHSDSMPGTRWLDSYEMHTRDQVMAMCGVCGLCR
eukprot:13271141-Alexandrium_andersonii.AAC.1